jgi:hypothetical protein
MKTALCGTNSISAPRSEKKLHLLLAESINMTYVILPSKPKNIGGNLMSEKKKLALIVHSGTLDKLYCAFILGSTATTMGWEAHLYFTFWGLGALVKGAMEKVGLPSDYKNME